MAKTEILVFGAGGFGREVAAMLRFSALSEDFELLGFIDDALEPGTVVNGLMILGDTEYLLKTEKPLAVAMGIGKPAVRRAVVEKLLSNRKLQWPNLLHPMARLHDKESIVMGRGNIVCDGNIITTNVSLGNFNIINLCCTLGHDSWLGDYCSLMPTVNVSGGAILEDEVYVGTGAKLIKATTLGKGCTVGAGAVVNKDVSPGIMVKGVPAK